MSAQTDKIREALRMAHSAFLENEYELEDQLSEALDALSELEAQPQQEPVAYTTALALEVSRDLAGTIHGTIDASVRNIWGEKGVPLYRSPQTHDPK